MLLPNQKFQNSKIKKCDKTKRSEIPMTTVTEEQMRKWVSDTICTVNDTVKTKPDTDEYDKRIQDDIMYFLNDEKFYSMPLTIVCRNIKRSGVKFSSELAAKAIKSSINYHKHKGMLILYYISLEDPSGNSAFEAIKVLNDSSIMKAIIDHPFEAPPKEKSELEIELEEKLDQRKNLMTETSKKANKAQDTVKEMNRKINELKEYKKRNKGWPEERAKHEDEIETLISENVKLVQENQKWKNAAFREFSQTKEYNQDIFDACEKNDPESIVYLINKDPKLANSTTMIDNEPWTPLMIAVKNQNMEIVQILVSNGADVNHKEWHNSVIDIAKDTGNKELIRFLRKSGADDPDNSDNDDFM